MSASQGFAEPPQLLDAAAVRRSVLRLSHEILERHADVQELVLAGVRTRGLPLAQRIAHIIAELCGVSPAVCAIDVTAFRDDRQHDGTEPTSLAGTDGNGAADITDRTVIIVDDVLFTGRTVRAAIDALLSHGRPKAVEVLALVDRGHRELPLRATYVGKNVPTSVSERVRVRLAEVDSVDGAWLVGAVPA